MIFLTCSASFLIGMFIGQRLSRGLRGGRNKIIVPRKLEYPRA